MTEYPPALLNFLQSEYGRGDDPNLNSARATALDYYQGMPFGDETEGQSQAVTRDVSEVIDYMTVGILNTVLSNGKAVEFETEPEQDTDENGQPATDPPIAEGQEPKPRMVDYGEQATAAVQYQFMRKQKGYRLLHDVLKAGMLEKSAVVGSFAIPQRPLPEQRTVSVDQITEDDDGVLVDGMAASIDGLVQADDGMALPGYHVTVQVPQPPMFRDMAVPNEYFRVSADATDLDEAAYVGHATPVSLSDLLEMGYDREEVESLYGNMPSDTTLERARDTGRSQTRDNAGRNGAERVVWLMTEYPLFDLDGDGIAERLFVHRVGTKLLRVMPIDEQPYSEWSPFPMPFRRVGQSVADKTMDIQRIRSINLRQGLNSLYLSNMPRIAVSEESTNENTLDDLLNVAPGGIVRFKGGVPPQPLQMRDTSSSSFQAMEMMSAERESRTGITRQSQGLNPDTMNKTATGMAMLQTNSQQIELYVARNFVEMLVAPMFAKRYRLMRAYGTPFRMKIEGKWQTIDPRKWPEDMDVRINVGLGTGDKSARRAARSELMEIQKALVEGGSRIVGDEQIYQNVRGFIADSDIPGVASDYVMDPSTLPPPPEQPDPETAKVQGEQQLKAQSQQHAHDQAMERIQLAREEGQVKAEIERDRAAAQIEAGRDKADQEMQLQRDRAVEETRLAEQRYLLETSLAERRFAFEQEQARAKVASQTDNDLPDYRPGGSLDA